MLEGSAALFVTPKLAVGTEFKQQIDGIANLNSALDNQLALAFTWTK